MAEDQEVLFSTNFSSPELDPRLSWLNEPHKSEIITEAGDAKGLQISMDKETDFWQKTYYEPPMVKDNGHVLYMEKSETAMVTETSFILTAVNQFDQAGLIVKLDEDHWMKTGLEYVDGSCRFSVVVTNTYSDWSTQDWPSFTLHVRVYRLKNDFVVEASPDGEAWSMMRIFHLDVLPNAALKTGLTACAPSGVGGQVTFHKLLMKRCKGYHHKA